MRTAPPSRIVASFASALPLGTRQTRTLSFLRHAGLWACAALLFAAPAQAQRYFGMNQVEYRHLRWRVIETEHFLVHYYPEEKVAAHDAARMAERAYTRLSRLIGHQFREKKPIMLFASRADFGENNVTGDLGEGTGGVTDGSRQRIILPFTGDYASFEHVLIHEMVHQFQYDVFSRGKAGANLQLLEQVNPPLWFMEGMAEYLSLGPNHILTNTWVRSAVASGKFPSIKQMTNEPNQYFPYRYGEALFAYIGQRWGDVAIGEILHSVTSLGIERGFQRELGLSLEQLSDQWREAMRAQYLPQLASLQRVRDFAQPMLDPKRSGGGEIFLAPVLSHDGNYIAFLANGSEKRGEIFIDLWLGDARTGKRIRRLVKSTTNPNFEELRLLYSQGGFSPDDRYFAFTAQTGGRDVLSIADVKSGKVKQYTNIPLDAVMSPTWSPDGKQIAFSGMLGGIANLYVVNADGTDLRALTNDRFGAFMPAWSPDGKTLAYATDRGSTNLTNLDVGKWRIALMNVEDASITEIPNQAGLNLNPAWSPDGKSIAFVSDRSGTANIHLYDLDTKTTYRLTNVQGGVSAITEYSPAITWSRNDRLAFNYYDDGNYTIWALDNPRAYKHPDVVVDPSAMPAPGTPGVPTPQVAATPQDTTKKADSTAARPSRSTYRAAGGARRSGQMTLQETRRDSVAGSSVASMLADPNTGLPDTLTFKDTPYSVRFSPEYISGGGIGISTGGGFGTQFGSATTLVFADLTGDHQIAVGAGINGRLSDASFLLGYANFSRRLQYSAGLNQDVMYIYSGGQSIPIQNGQRDQYQFIRYVFRQASVSTEYPLNRFTRFEIGLQGNAIARSVVNVNYDYYQNVGLSGIGYEKVAKLPSLNFVSPVVAFVSDNTLGGMTGPITGRRWRMSAAPAVGNVRWIDYLLDYRRYDPVIFNTITFASRLYGNATYGRDQSLFPKYIGQPDFIRGYDRASFYSGYQCNVIFGSPNQSGNACASAQLVGTRVAVFNEELRFPLIRRFDLGSLPIGLPPVDGLMFFDAGLAWNPGQKVSISKPANYDLNLQRYLVKSWGFGLRVNAFNLLILRWDYAKPMDRGNDNSWNWTFSIGPSF